MKRYLPERYDETKSLFDAFDSLFKPLFFEETREMRTDISETENGYRLDIEMPGFKKNEISVSLDDGYLNVSGTKKSGGESGGAHGGRYLRKERSESFRRTFFVGDDVPEESIKAKYEDGVLCLTLPKSQPKQARSHSIAIE